jgi:3',5'-cyclic AMP phosphodiesterase CpdA
MRTIIHLSDLHFGRIDPTILSPLIQTIHDLQPNLVVVSGDLTQRARSHQFRAARAFLDALPQPQIVVPGNHDIPMHNIFSRFFNPLDKYRRYIQADLQPFYTDQELAVLGLNTARSLTIKGGRINEAQVNLIRERLCAQGKEITKIIVTHHPFDLPAGYRESDLVGRARIAMETLAACGADLFLAGHMHITHTGHTAKRYPIGDHSALVVQAGTATSTRLRGEVNSFNCIRVAHPEVMVERLIWDATLNHFRSATTERFQQQQNTWERLA